MLKVKLQCAAFAIAHASMVLAKGSVFGALVLAVSLMPLAYTKEGNLYPENKPSSPIYSLSDGDFRAQYLSSLLTDNSYQNRLDIKQLVDESTIPKKWDWRNKNAVTPVKNQKLCGGCWAFSSVETVESAYSIKYNLSKSGPPHLSVQEIIDCSSYNHGCKGGSAGAALMWLQDTSKPIVRDDCYPLTDKNQKCNVTALSKCWGVKLLGYKMLTPIANETLLMSLIYQHGPVSAAVDSTTWNQYMGGIIQYHCGRMLNHAIQIVGYDATGDVPYYIVRNSWGTSWGHDGYVYVRIGDNTCGIADNVAVVLDVSK